MEQMTGAVGSAGIGGSAFGQGEPLTLRLRGLLREYPRGSILKELLQNADDAGARRVCVTVDWRTHSAEVPHANMRKLLGPALLVHNDAAFTPADFESIKRIGFSGKSNDLAKTGRFGIGFNAVYHVTDWPSFLSRESLIVFDPHCSAVPCSYVEPGWRWEYASEGWWQSYPGFLGTYVAGGLPDGAADYHGTIFRLPLRTLDHARNSEISSEAYTEAEVSELLKALSAEGEQLLLFLKSVEEIEVREIRPGPLGERVLLHVCTENVEQVRTDRDRVLQVVSESPKDLLDRCTNAPDTLPTFNYRHEISTRHLGEEHRSVWRVTGGLFVDSTGELVEAMNGMRDRGDKAVPWGGVAARILTECGEGVTPSVAVAGRAYCFLPLPVLTGLPVHVNGFFDLDSSRHGLTVEEGLSATELVRARWNRLLVRHVLVPACADLITALADDIGGEKPDEYYRLWPLHMPASPVFSDLPGLLANELKNRTVIRAADPRSGPSAYKWLTPTQVDAPPWDANDAIAPLSFEFNVPAPAVPRSIATRLGIKEITPSRVRSQLVAFEKSANGVPLSQAPRMSLRRFDWVVALLRLSLSDGHADLSGLPLAVTADGKLRSFGQPHLFVKDEETRHLFAARSDWFLHSKLITAVPDLEKRLPQLRGIRRMNPEDVATHLGGVLSAVESAAGLWNPTAESAPNTAWLVRVFRYYARQQSLSRVQDTLRKLPLIPGDNGLLHKGGTTSTPLLCPANVSEAKRRSLSQFGVCFAHGHRDLLEALSDLEKRHPDSLVWPVTAPDVIDMLAARPSDSFPPYSEASVPIYNDLLDFLTHEHAAIDAERRKKVRALRVFPTTSGGCVALTDPEVYLPGGYEPPAIAEGIHLLRTGPEALWRPLLAALGARPLDRATLIQRFLLPHYAAASTEQQRQILAWIRDNMEQAQTETANQQGKDAAIRQLVLEGELVRCKDGILRSVRDVYDPQSEIVTAVLGPSAPLPDREVYADDWPRWSDFFRHLGWMDTPAAPDLLRHVDQLIERSHRAGPIAVSSSCMAVYDHLRQHLHELKDQLVPSGGASPTTVTLARALKDRAWLPALDDPKELKRYPGAKSPEARLYRPVELIVTQQAHVVASQRVLMRLPQPPNDDMRNALGFRLPERDEVVSHLQVLVSLWESGEIPRESEDAFTRSLSSVYRYIDENFVRGSEDKRWLLRQLQEERCLWDGAGVFWIPGHAFQKRGECFGSRRLTFRPAEPYVQAVYLLLGQKEEPEPADFVEFLYELQSEYDERPLGLDDQSRAKQVLQRLGHAVDQPQAGLPVLTRDGRLLPAHCVVIPDAPWFESYLDCSATPLLCSEVDPYLAESAGAVSLSRDGFQEPTAPVRFASDPETKNLCDRWQATCVSREFSEGLKRLVCHHYGLTALIAVDPNAPELAQMSVCAADEIPMSLYLRMDGQTLCVASGVEGMAHYDEDERTLFLRRDDPRSMLHYLAQAIQDYVLDGRGVHEGHLRDMIDTAPEGISALLDKRRVMRLSVPSEALASETELAHDATPLFDGFADETSDQDMDAGDREGDDVTSQGLAGDQVAPAQRLAVVSSGPRSTPAVSRSTCSEESDACSDDEEAEEKSDGVGRDEDELNTEQNSRTVPPSVVSTARQWSAGHGANLVNTEATRERRDTVEQHTNQFARPPVPEQQQEARPHNAGIPDPGAHTPPESHTPYGGELFQSTPSRPFDTTAIQRLFPTAEEASGAGTTIPDRSRRRRSPGYSGPMEPVNNGIAYLLARSFEEGMLWLQDPKPAALFPDAEALRDTAGERYFPVTLMGEDANPLPLQMAIDYQQEVIHFTKGTDRERFTDFLFAHGLRPGCELTVHRLENGGYRLGYVSSPTRVVRVPFLTLDDNGRPVVQESTEAVELPCPVNEQLLLGQQRFADDEAWRALNELARRAPDLFQAIVRLLEGRTVPVRLDDLYRLNFQIRPVSWSYFHSIIEMNSGTGQPFILQDGAVRLRPSEEVRHYALPRMRIASRAPVDWPSIEQELRRVLAPLAGGATGEAVDAILSIMRRCIPG